MRILFAVILVASLIGCSRSGTSTTIGLWGSYTNHAGGEKHYSFDLSEYKTGLFLGMCPTTKQLQWSYHFDLAGEGPAYKADQLKVDHNIASIASITGVSNVYLKVASGRVAIDRPRSTVTIDLQIEKDGITNGFVGNGTYAFREKTP